MKRYQIVALTAYVIVAFFTFGHAANGSDKARFARLADCREADKHFCSEINDSAIVGVMAGVIWPLYWSWELQA